MAFLPSAVHRETTERLCTLAVTLSPDDYNRLPQSLGASEHQLRGALLGILCRLPMASLRTYPRQSAQAKARSLGG